MEKTDIRVQLTKKALRESLVALMMKKSIVHISVREICEGAGVSRTTFYTYYKDQYDMLEQFEEKILGKVQNLILKYAPQDEALSAGKLVELIERMLRYITRNINAMQLLLGKNSESGFQRKLAKYLTGYVWKLSPPPSQSHQKEKNAGSYAGGFIAKYRSVFIMNGFVALLQEWLKSDMETNIRDTAKTFAKLLRSVAG
jgi:AcrR family transcriptional regulator